MRFSLLFILHIGLQAPNLRRSIQALNPRPSIQDAYLGPLLMASDLNDPGP